MFAKGANEPFENHRLLLSGKSIWRSLQVKWFFHKRLTPNAQPENAAVCSLPLAVSMKTMEVNVSNTIVKHAAFNILCRRIWNSKLDLIKKTCYTMVTIRKFRDIRTRFVMNLHSIEQPLYGFSQFDNIFYSNETYLDIICRKYSSPSI